MAKAADKSAPPGDTPVSFEAALAELEGIVKAMEGNGQLALEDSLSAYQRGMTLLRYCQSALTAAEQKIQILDQDTLRDFSPDRDA